MLTTAVVCLALLSRTFPNSSIKNMLFFFITIIVCYNDLDWDDEKYFPDGKEDEDDEEDDDDDDNDNDDKGDERENNNPLSNPLKKSSDPFIRFWKIFRRFRRRRRCRRGGFRFRGFFGRRRGGR